MSFSSKIRSHLVVQQCAKAGIVHVVLSPGSRNAPLIMDFTGYKGFQCYSIVDERSAGFFALGLAQQTKKPVALVCTSGTALLNYYPAVAEAYYSEIPLVVISADRPEEFIGIGEGQTIEQRSVFGKHIGKEVHLSSDDLTMTEHTQELIQTLTFACSKRLPIHINIPFAEPLYDLLDGPMTIEHQGPAFSTEAVAPMDRDIKESQTAFANYQKIMILVGTLPEGTISQVLIDFMASDPSVLVLKESTSNLHHPNFISGIDQLISALGHDEFAELKPDLLITMGGMVISKRIKSFLRQYKPECHWHIGEGRANNTFFALTDHWNMAPERFWGLMTQTQSKPSGYRDYWRDIAQQRRSAHERFVSSAPFSDLSVYAQVMKSIPDHYIVHMANSAGVRYAQLMPQNPSHHVYCNRGTSGIEGSSSTSVGAASIAKRPVVLITGDLSFFYDSNAFWNQYVPQSYRVILVNNEGGGIFRILPKAKSIDGFAEFLETKHTRSAQTLISEYNWGYKSVASSGALVAALLDFFDDSDQPKLLEIKTPSTLNDEVLTDYFRALEPK